jgi:hypothetical protein
VRGGVTLELIIAFPVWLCFLLATVQFGWLMANLEQVALASRVGALEASQTASLPSSGPVPAEVVTVVEHQLQSAGIDPWCHIFLEHNVESTTNIQLSSANPSHTGSCTCSPPTSTELPFPDCAEYVRVTVCIPMTAVTPNLLKACGFAIDEKFIRHTSTFRYELSPAATGGSGCSCNGP